MALRFLPLILALLLTPPAWAQDGKALYERKCAQCHGSDGKGEGISAPFLYPKPRDFTRGLYKLRTTPSGQLPTDADLLKVISDGMHATSMVGWKRLSERERLELVRYIKGFSERFKGEPPPQPIKIGKEIKPSKESIAKGRQLYQDLECFKCHGQEGRGDGPSAPELEDDWGNPIRPANLTKPWTFRGGSSARDIFIRFMTGMAGTPMPSYADSIESPDDAWHLANYVRSLAMSEAPEYGTLLPARYTKGPIPDDIDHPLWKEAKGVNFPLVGQVILDPRLFTPSVDMVTAKALYNDKEVALLILWDDPNQGGPDAPDALAIQFPAKVPEGLERPYFLMGDASKPVYMLKWSSDGGVKELNAWGVDKQTVQPQEGQTAKGRIIYHQGQYRLLLRRALTTADTANDIQFEVGKFIPIAFMAWDGSNGERGSKMSLSSWYYFILEEPPSRKPFLYPPIAALVAVGVEFLIYKRLKRRKA